MDEDGMMDCLDRKPIEAVHLRQDALGAFEIRFLEGETVLCVVTVVVYGRSRARRVLGLDWKSFCAVV
jgi:hypothetical protein